MAEASPDAMFLITISWQALNRAIKGSNDTEHCDCTIIILFASFFIEANINYIIEYMKMTQQMRQFHGMKKNQHPGLQRKLGWFYNQFVARNEAKSSSAESYKGIRRKLGRKFPGFCTISNFRNIISHGVIDLSIAKVVKAKELRQNAKNIVEELFKIAKNNDYDIPRIIT